MTSESIFVLGFIAFVFLILAIDLGLFAKTDKPVSIKRAAIMSVIWITLALCFYFII